MWWNEIRNFRTKNILNEISVNFEFSPTKIGSDISNRIFLCTILLHILFIDTRTRIWLMKLKGSFSFQQQQHVNMIVQRSFSTKLIYSIHVPNRIWLRNRYLHIYKNMQIISQQLKCIHIENTYWNIRCT